MSHPRDHYINNKIGDLHCAENEIGVMRVVSFVTYFKTAISGCRAEEVHRKRVHGSYTESQ
jgi:hypothetical protein